MKEKIGTDRKKLHTKKPTKIKGKRLIKITEKTYFDTPDTKKYIDNCTF